MDYVAYLRQQEEKHARNLFIAQQKKQAAARRKARKCAERSNRGKTKMQQVKVLDWRNNGERVTLECSDRTRTFDLDDFRDRDNLYRIIKRVNGEPIVAALNRAIGTFINVP